MDRRTRGPFIAGAASGWLLGFGVTVIEYQPARTLPWAPINMAVGIAVGVVGIALTVRADRQPRRVGRVSRWERRRAEAVDQERRLLQLQNWDHRG